MVGINSRSCGPGRAGDGSPPKPTRACITNKHRLEPMLHCFGLSNDLSDPLRELPPCTRNDDATA